MTWESKTLLRVLAKARSRNALLYLCAALLLATALVLAGADISHHVTAIEAWIASLGPWGLVAFVVILVLATSVLIPGSVLSIAAGALFGLAQGLALVLVANLLAAALQYLLARRLLRAPIDRFVARRPALAAIQRAVHGDELRLQALLRMMPLNPATISYLLGAAGVSFGGFIFACLALSPHLFLEVYVGYAGKHAAHVAGRDVQQVYVHDLVVFGGLAVTIVVITLLSRLAHRALTTAMAGQDTDSVGKA